METVVAGEGVFAVLRDFLETGVTESLDGAQILAVMAAVDELGGRLASLRRRHPECATVAWSEDVAGLLGRVGPRAEPVHAARA